MIKCDKCNSIPNDNDVIGWKCNSCGKAFKVSKLKLHSILMKKTENPEKSYISCPSCKNSLDDGNECIVWKCACGNMNMAKLKDFEEERENTPKSNLIKCPECGKEISSKAKRCVHCGKSFSEDLKRKVIICPECENEIERGTKICPKCGAPITRKGIKLSEKAKRIIFVLTAIIGVICVGIIISYFALQDYFSYKEAMNNFNQGNYQLAAEQFSVLEEYKDSSAQYQNCIYTMAKELYQDGKLSEAAEQLETVRDYSDSEDILKDIYYTQAHEFYDAEEYEKAIPLFENAAGYKDADELLADSQYQISTDGQFLKALKIGLQNRWDLTNNQITVEVMGLPVNTSTVDDYKKFVQQELDQISIYEKKEFNDEGLGRCAKEYIAALHLQEKALAYKAIDSDRYDTEWGEGLNKRSKLLKELVSKYNFTVDDEYLSNLNEMVLRGEVNKEHENLELQIQKMINVDYTLSSGGKSSKTYEMVIENTSVVNFSSFHVNVKLVNDEGVVVETVKTNTVKDFISGQKAIFSFKAEREFSSIIPSADYSIA